MLTGKGDLFAVAALVLLHAGDAMVASIVDLNLPVAGVDGEPSTVAEKRISGLVLTPGGIGAFSKLFWPPSPQRFHRFHGLHGFIPDMGCIGFIDFVDDGSGCSGATLHISSPRRVNSLSS